MPSRRPEIKSSEPPINHITLRFYQDRYDLEKKYRSHSFERSLQHFRMCHWLAILFYSGYFFLDYYLSPENFYNFLLIRFAVVSPLFGVGIVLTYFPWYKRIYSYMLSFYVLLTSCGSIVMGVMAPNDIHYAYFIGVLVSLVFGYTFIRLPLKFAAVSGLIVIIMYWMAQVAFGDLPESTFFTCFSYLLGLNLLLTIICYTAEKMDRHNFYLSFQLEKKQNQINQINKDLESVVQQRMVELQNLKKALNKIKTLSGLLPICAHCKKIRDDKGYWQQVEKYVMTHSEARFSHGICPDCIRELYPDIADDILNPSKDE